MDFPKIVYLLLFLLQRAPCQEKEPTYSLAQKPKIRRFE
ncbi:hypothetical protein LEP1GSC187_2229 [Leptospira santarosai str. ZUN179]|uniref:Uncharacterized protein n=1 Tax=Leptospira santarosai str. ZUN179 TaxID=1049985 RepID=M6UVE6_9LEPT|nr:hypothetical protein LEP1GSC187_2229 [Leptospira santarosai str. ZUN179]